MSLNESHVEAAALDWFQELGYAIAHGTHPRHHARHTAAEVTERRVEHY